MEMRAKWRNWDQATFGGEVMSLKLSKINNEVKANEVINLQSGHCPLIVWRHASCLIKTWLSMLISFIQISSHVFCQCPPLVVFLQKPIDQANRSKLNADCSLCYWLLTIRRQEYNHAKAFLIHKPGKREAGNTRIFEAKENNTSKRFRCVRVHETEDSKLSWFKKVRYFSSPFSKYFIKYISPFLNSVFSLSLYSLLSKIMKITWDVVPTLWRECLNPPLNLGVASLAPVGPGSTSAITRQGLVGPPLIVLLQYSFLRHKGRETPYIHFLMSSWPNVLSSGVGRG